MKFNKYQQSQIPEVNLVPMMDVIMTILTFFILVSMTLTSSKSVDAILPSTDKGVNNKPAPEPLIIGMTRAGQTEINNATVTEAQIAEQVAAYFQRNPQGAIVLKADKSLAYEKVVQTLGTLRDVGGDRVSLAIE
ncbi:ExbD/TolR family protein [Leptolyngbya sp. GGD]|uniref:ExbD/TolR family protein n=1 Tax=Leptolyngbya sp. GGD TaxID=2997907 RepID=UPI00227B21C9|nr:biopolymer transporter ExbD [Leptolyngbya sp. GGD]MCY6493663.1 biopolymer transporter ExbD [Leptolyngbya sp. GGD]